MIQITINHKKLNVEDQDIINIYTYGCGQRETECIEVLRAGKDVSGYAIVK